MKRLVSFATPWWLGGMALAAIGVSLVRLVAPLAGPTGRPWVDLAGKLLAAGGMFVIALGVSKRVRREPLG